MSSSANPLPSSPAPRVRLGNSDLAVSPVGFGCWPIAGVSSLHVSDQHSQATLHAALDAGINFFDTAYSYGYDGEADRLLRPMLRDHRTDMVLSSKVGQYFDERRQRIVDGSPATLQSHAQQILQRLDVDEVDIMYLHCPDARVPVAESAGAIREIVDRGWSRYAGVSNVNAEQLEIFQRECPVVVAQPPFNMLQQQAVVELRDFCACHTISLVCYWVLMKGLLAGRLMRDHRFDPSDKRVTYPIFQGEAWERAQDLLDELRSMAAFKQCTVAQLVIAWTLRQPGVTVALCGAKRAEQIIETAGAMNVKLESAEARRIDRWAEQFGGDV